MLALVFTHLLAPRLAWLGVFELEKVLYEIEYEANHRPHWLGIPVRGALRLLNSWTR